MHTNQIRIRKANDRGLADHGWLHSRFTFSFSDYFDPEQMGFRSLRVINDDIIDPGEGFEMHSHENMEIITYVIEGALEHKDSLGNGSIIRPGDVQRMSAGTGIRHSEFNPLPDRVVHLLQLWIRPNELNVTPSYEQHRFTVAEKTNRLRLVASPDGAEGSVSIHQDARLYASILEPGIQLTHPTDPDRPIWIQVVSGKLTLNGQPLETGDGAAMDHPENLTLTGIEPSEILLFDLA